MIGTGEVVVLEGSGGRRRMLGAGDREEISRGIAEGAEGVVIAARIGRDPSVVSREIARHGGRERYRATRAGRGAGRARCRPKVRRLDADPVLRAGVTARLRAGYSPEQVAGRLRYEHGGEHAERAADTVSHEAIYTWIHTRYITVVIDHDTGGIVWAAEGRSSEVVHEFLDALGPDRARQLTHVSADGAEWIHVPFRARAPRAVICLDPFHVVAWAVAAVDKVRRRLAAELRRDGRADQAATIKHTRWALITDYRKQTPSSAAASPRSLGRTPRSTGGT